MSNASESDDLALKARKTIWLWVLATVMALAFLFGVMKWTGRRERLNQAKPVPSYFVSDPDI